MGSECSLDLALTLDPAASSITSVSSSKGERDVNFGSKAIFCRSRSGSFGPYEDSDSMRLAGSLKRSE